MSAEKQVTETASKPDIVDEGNGVKTVFTGQKPSEPDSESILKLIKKIENPKLKAFALRLYGLS